MASPAGFKPATYGLACPLQLSLLPKHLGSGLSLNHIQNGLRLPPSSLYTFLLRGLARDYHRRYPL